MIWVPILKTTIDITDELAQDAKAHAAELGVTFRELVEQGLRQVLRDARAGREFVLRDASVGGSGLQDEFKDAGWEQIRGAIYSGRGG